MKVLFIAEAVIVGMALLFLIATASYYIRRDRRLANAKLTVVSEAERLVNEAYEKLGRGLL